jgi:hypothetical protein
MTGQVDDFNQFEMFPIFVRLVKVLSNEAKNNKDFSFTYDNITITTNFWEVWVLQQH